MTSPAVQNNHETIIKRWRKVIRRAAAAMKESRRQDLLVLARVALEAAILDELVLLDLLPASKPSPIKSTPAAMALE